MSGLRAVHEWDDEWPDHGTLVFRERAGGPRDRPLPAGLLPPDEYDEAEDTVNGTLALTGAGWFHGTLRFGDRPPAVRVEVWDGPLPHRSPADASWAAADLVADLPYWSPTGTVRSDQLVPGAGGREIPLPGPGGYLVRTWCRPEAGSAEAWLLQFGPTGDTAPEPARWLRRDWTRPVAPDSDWSGHRADRVVTPEEGAAIERAEAERVHGDLARDVRAAVVWAPHRLLPATLAELADRLRAEPAAVRGALTHLARCDRVAVHGDPADPHDPLLLAAELPDPYRGEEYRRQLEDNLRRAAGIPVRAAPPDPAAHLRPTPHLPTRPEAEPAPRRPATGPGRTDPD